MADYPTTGYPDRSDGEENACTAVRRIQLYLEQLRHRENPTAATAEEWDEVFRMCSPIFSRLVHLHHWPDCDREDGVQELWLVLIDRLPELRFEPCRGELRDWISAVARHRLADHDRYRRNRSSLSLAPETTDRLTGREQDPAVAFDRNQVVEAVRAALAELRPNVSDRDYDAFTLKWLEGLSVREVAGRLGMSESQVWGSHHRILERLRPLLARRLNSFRS